MSIDVEKYDYKNADYVAGWAEYDRCSSNVTYNCIFKRYDKSLFICVGDDYYSFAEDLTMDETIRLMIENCPHKFKCLQ